MKTISITKDELVISLAKEEATLLNNALNEVCHGIKLDEPEFKTRLGVSKERANQLLHELAGSINSSDS